MFQMVNLLLLLPICTVAIQISKYVRTKVLDETKSCKYNRFYNHVITTISSSVIDCSSQCSSTTDCRRIMFDRTTNICSMFESGENCFSHENIQDKICFRQKSVCTEINCIRCPVGYYGDVCEHIIQDCTDGLGRAPNKSLMAYIKPSHETLEIKCLFDYGGLTYIQHRTPDCQEVDFNRTWDEYENGFGYKHGEYWLGLKHIYEILQNYPKFELVVSVTREERLQGYYKDFTLTNSSDGYSYSSSPYKGHSTLPCGDSLTNDTLSIIGRPFSTYDRDYSNNNCPDRFKGGWWYLDDPVCSRANLNGRWNDSNFEANIHWLEPAETIREVHLRVRRK